MSISVHIARTDNPHLVTKEQLGLGSVNNYPMASRETVLALTSQTNYVDLDNLAWVSEAFTNYMDSLGLLNPDGSFVTVPYDTLGTPYFTLDETVYNLEGTHPTAFSVRATIESNGVVLGELPAVNLTADYWNLPLASLNLVPGNTYLAKIVYLDSLGEPISQDTAILISLSLGIIEFSINEDTNLAVLAGGYNGYGEITATITDSVGVVYTGTALLNNGVYVFDLSTTPFSVLSTYTVEVLGTLGTNTKLVTRNNSISVTANGTITYIDPATGLTVVDFRDIADLDNATVYYVDQGAIV